MSDPSVTSTVGVSIERIKRDIDQLATFGATESGGVSRTSFSKADKQMRQWLAADCEEYGLRVRTDGIGNIFIRVDAPYAPSDALPVWTGSHLDSVPEGGRFDGIVGSIAAIEIARRLHEERIRLKRPVEVVIFADEEGNYHHLLGSSALVANYTWDELTELRGRDGDRLVDALAAMGWEPREATQTALNPGAAHAFLELHIEQGPVLEATNTDIGVVTAIVGLGGGMLEFIGRQDHAGTTPMTMRRDALGGAGALLARLPEIAAGVSDRAVVTCGLLEVEPGGTNVVPVVARLHLDFREPELDGLLNLERAIVTTATRVANERELEIRYRRESITEPVPLDTGLQELISKTAKRRGKSTRQIPSGAGHDSQNMAHLAPTAMIFIPSAQGRSHSPHENSSWNDIETGANVLLDAVIDLATR